MSDQTRTWDPDKAFYVPGWVIDSLLGASNDPPAFHVVATTPKTGDHVPFPFK